MSKQTTGQDLMGETLKSSQEAIQKGVEIGFEAQEKAEEVFSQGLQESFEVAKSGLRQYRQFAASMQAAMPWTAPLQPAAELGLSFQEKAIDAARESSAAAFEAYKKSLAEPTRKYVKEAMVKLAEKAVEG